MEVDAPVDTTAAATTSEAPPSTTEAAPVAAATSISAAGAAAPAEAAAQPDAAAPAPAAAAADPSHTPTPAPTSDAAAAPPAEAAAAPAATAEPEAAAPVAAPVAAAETAPAEAAMDSKPDDAAAPAESDAAAAAAPAEEAAPGAASAEAPATAEAEAGAGTSPDQQPGPDNGKRARTEGAADVSGGATAGASEDGAAAAAEAPAGAPEATAGSETVAAAAPTEAAATPAPAAAAAVAAVAGTPAPAPAPAPGSAISTLATPGEGTPNATAGFQTTNQLQYIKNTLIKSMKKHKHVWPFKKPVDHVGLGLINYLDIIKVPMDISTVEANLKAKPCKYAKAQEAIDDLNLMVENCCKYNRETDDIYTMAKELQAYMNQQLVHMPTPETPVTIGQRSRSKVSATSRSFAGVINTSGTPLVGPGGRRPSMRSIRPAMKDLPGESFSLPVSTGPKKKKQKLGARMKYCNTLMRELMAKKHEKIAWAFYEPVNWQAFGLMDYPTIITSPMDLGTAKKKLESGQYAESEQFVDDIRLVFSNCYKYNDKESEYVVMAQKLSEAFEYALAKMPDEPEPVPEPVVAEPPKPAAVTPMPSEYEKLSKQPNSFQPMIPAEPLDKVQPLIPEAAPTATASKKSSSKKANDSSSDSSSSSSDSEEDPETKFLMSQLERLQSDLTKIQKGKSGKKKKKTKKKKKKKTKKKHKKEKKPSKKAAPAKKPAGARKPSATKRKQSAPKSAAPKAQKRKAEDSDDSDDEYDSSDHEEDGHMTYEQKKTLSETINTLQDYQVQEVVAIIRGMDTDALQQNADGELEIDFQRLKIPTLKKLEKFVSDCKKAKKPKKKKPKQSLAQQIEDKKRALNAMEADEEAQPAAAAGGGEDSSSSGSGSSSSSDDEAEAPQSAAAAPALNPASVS